MNKLFFIALTCVTMLGVSCTKPASETQSKFPAACGGYTDYRALAEEDATLFAEVYDAEPALTPYAVATQVVAGSNYRFLCRDEAEQEYVVSIFVPLPCNADSQQPRVTNVQFPYPGTLTGMWTVRKIDEIVLTEDSVEYPKITFREDGAIYATAGCNGMGSNYTYESGKLTIHDGMCQTEMWCENEEMMRNEGLLGETFAGELEVSSVGEKTIMLKGKHSLMLIESCD